MAQWMIIFKYYSHWKWIIDGHYLTIFEGGFYSYYIKKINKIKDGYLFWSNKKKIIEYCIYLNVNASLN